MATATNPSSTPLIMNRDIDFGLVARARSAAAEIAPLSERIEAERRLVPDAVRALGEAGVWKLLVPRRLGGTEASLATALTMYEEIARVDGSSGWCAMIGATSGLMSAWMDPELAREVYGPDDAITAGVFAPMGRARREADGVRVTGRWPFASGCEHSSWRMGGVLLYDGDAPVLLPSGAPHVYSVMFRANETEIHSTWDTSGLRGTGSHDLAVVDRVVPNSRMFSLFAASPHEPGELYRLPLFSVLASGVAAVTLGIARGAIDALVSLASKKRPAGAKRTIAHRELVQLDVARAEAKVRAARAFLYEAVYEAIESVRRDGVASVSSRAILRNASCHAAAESAAAVDLMYNAGGTTGIYSAHPLQRHFRDVHVATQHVMVSPMVTTQVGRILLGLEIDHDTL